MNYVETIALFTLCLSVVALVWPEAAIVFGTLNFVVRIGFLLTYKVSPQLRIIFAPAMMMNMIATQLTAVYAAYSLINEVSQIQN